MWLACAAACGGAPPHGPFWGDEKLLVVGVDPETEANEVVRELGEHGFFEVRRLRAPTFTALGFAPVKGNEEAGRVRVVTSRGISLSLDSDEPTALTLGHLRQLLDFPYRDSHDLNGDGDEELFVREQPLPRGEPCVRAYRVRRTGVIEELSSFALPRPAESPDPGWTDVTFCEAGEPTKPKADPDPDPAPAPKPTPAP